MPTIFLSLDLLPATRHGQLIYLLLLLYHTDGTRHSDIREHEVKQAEDDREKILFLSFDIL